MKSLSRCLAIRSCAKVECNCASLRNYFIWKW